MLFKKEDFFMYKRILTVSLCFTVLLLVIGILPVHGEDKIYESTVRLHVIANSDSEEDQAIKLQVRDAVLAVTNPLLSECRDREEAIVVLEGHTKQIEAAANAVLRDAGKEERAEVLLGWEQYPERSYDAFCFPAGEYISLRVLIGSGEGKNWWCCLFPPLCLGAATVGKTSAEDAFISVGLTPTQYQIITESDRPVYRVRFKLLEVFSSRK